ncbi:hypothetical protein R3P38DRAFT_2983097 [Favolaschia claudopus]|uniref:Uncharacterized protein n=1 Tax=Favolaschia claudopus TaxID=2862362 RepID=A0AAW0AY81_9AGAR
MTATPLLRETRPLKRRRLSPASSTPSTAPQAALTAPKTPPGVCASCHRAATTNPILFCPRCNASTCTVCSRTCTARAPLSSKPQSPLRRPALAVNAANTNTNTNNNSPAEIPAPVKRKKSLWEEDEGERQGQDGQEFGSGTGCSRTVCRACCFESPEETTTCYDCCT